MNERDMLLESERKIREWIRENADHPLIKAIKEWSGHRHTDAYRGEGYCEMINIVSGIIILPNLYTSSANHLRYRMISDIIMEEEGDLRALVESWCEREGRRR